MTVTRMKKPFVRSGKRNLIKRSLILIVFNYIINIILFSFPGKKIIFTKLINKLYFHNIRMILCKTYRIKMTFFILFRFFYILPVL